MPPLENDQKAPPAQKAAAVLDALKLDFNTIKIILLTACVVLALVAIPLTFMLKHFVSFDALDNYFKLTDSVRPKILHTISEVLDSGYSKNFVFEPNRPADNTMLFYAAPKQKVTLSVSAQISLGNFPATALYLNNCLLETRNEAFHFYEKDVTEKLGACNPDEPNLHTLRIVLPDGLPQKTTIQLKSLVLVYQRVHDHVEGVDTK
jgi:hypothetical protein